MNQMKVLIVISALVSFACAGVVLIPSATTVIGSPAHDSAIVRSERIGDNFAYYFAEGQAFQRAPLLASVRHRFSLFAKKNKTKTQTLRILIFTRKT